MTSTKWGTIMRLTTRNRQAAQEPTKDPQRHGEGQGKEGEEGEINESSFFPPKPPHTTKKILFLPNDIPATESLFGVDAGTAAFYTYLYGCCEAFVHYGSTAKRTKRHALDAGRRTGPRDGRPLFPRCRNSHGAGMGMELSVFLPDSCRGTIAWNQGVYG